MPLPARYLVTKPFPEMPPPGSDDCLLNPEDDLLHLANGQIYNQFGVLVLSMAEGQLGYGQLQELVATHPDPVWQHPAIPLLLAAAERGKAANDAALKKAERAFILEKGQWAKTHSYLYVVRHTATEALHTQPLGPGHPQVALLREHIKLPIHTDLTNMVLQGGSRGMGCIPEGNGCANLPEKEERAVLQLFAYVLRKAVLNELTGLAKIPFPPLSLAEISACKQRHDRIVLPGGILFEATYQGWLPGPEGEAFERALVYVLVRGIKELLNETGSAG